MLDKNKKTILLVDDDSAFQKSVSISLIGSYHFHWACDFESGYHAFSKNEVDVTLLDIDFGKEKNGIDLLKAIKQIDPLAPIIIVSSSSETDIVVEAMKWGACDYLCKSSDNLADELLIRLQNATKRSRTSRKLEGMKRGLSVGDPIVSKSQAIDRIMKELSTICPLGLFIEGETGVGKTPIAKYASTVAEKLSRSERPFIRVNCAGLTRERLQDELFGHKEGAFTSALTERQGLVDLAKGGDLFLDEVGDLDLECQGELLMFLDSGEYRRIGDSLLRHSDCNIIAATNRQIDERIKNGLFRKDLFSRLAGCRITVPPLRERKEDISPIMEFYIKDACGILKPYDSEILTLFEKFDWREGNVRELISATRYMCRKAKEEPGILISHMSPFYHAENGSLGASAVTFSNLVETQQVFQDGLDTYLSQIEKIILKKVGAAEPEVGVLAQKLKISEATLGRRLRKYELPRAR